MSVTHVTSYHLVRARAGIPAEQASPRRQPRKMTYNAAWTYDGLLRCLFINMTALTVDMFINYLDMQQATALAASTTMQHNHDVEQRHGAAVQRQEAHGGQRANHTATMAAGQVHNEARKVLGVPGGCAGWGCGVADTGSGFRVPGFQIP